MMNIYLFLIMANASLLISVVLWTIIKFSKRSKFLFLLIPLCFGSLYTNLIFSQHLLGYPTSDVPIEKVAMISYYTDEKTFIYYWVLPKDSEPRAIRRPYTREEHEKAEDASNAVGQGGNVRLGFQGANGGEYIEYDFGVVNQLPEKK